MSVKIINLRGTSGSGKTHIVRQIMEQYPQKARVKKEGRKQPLAYICSRPGHRSLVVVGHYETACGGCDTINSMDEIFEIVRRAASEGNDVLFEGLLISAEFNRTKALHDAFPEALEVLCIDIPLEQCLASVNSRRWAKNPEKPGVNPKNTEAKWKQTKMGSRRLREAGVRVHEGPRESVLESALSILGLGQAEIQVPA